MAIAETLLAGPIYEQPCDVVPETDLTIDDIRARVIKETGWAPLANGYMNYSRFEPEQVEDPTPIIIVPGYAGIEPAYENLGYAMAYFGKREAYTIHPVRRHKFTDAVHPTHLFNPLRLPGQAVYAVMRVARDLHASDQFDLYCHSMGGPTGIGTTLEKPDYIRIINLAGSAGLNGHNAFSLGRKLPGVVADIARSIPEVDIDPIAAVRHITEYLFNNLPRTMLEAAAVSQCDIREQVRTVRCAGKIVVRTQFTDDPFFPTAEVTEEDKRKVDCYTETPGGHLIPIIQPLASAKLHHAITGDLV